MPIEPTQIDIDYFQTGEGQMNGWLLRINGKWYKPKHDPCGGLNACKRLKQQILKHGLGELLIRGAKEIR